MESKNRCPLKASHPVNSLKNKKGDGQKGLEWNFEVVLWRAPSVTVPSRLSRTQQKVNCLTLIFLDGEKKKVSHSTLDGFRFKSVSFQNEGLSAFHGWVCLFLFQALLDDFWACDSSIKMKAHSLFVNENYFCFQMKNTTKFFYFIHVDTRLSNPTLHTLFFFIIILQNYIDNDKK